MRALVARLPRFALAVLALATLPAQAELAVTDDAGQRVVLARPAQRIVALSPHLAELFFAVGAGARVVATTEYADHPPAAQKIPRAARAHSVDLERVAAAQPDLIAVWGTGYPPAVIESLRRLAGRLGAALYVSEPGALETVATSLERLGTLTGSDTAEAAAERFRAQLADLRARYAARPPVTVFYQIWAQPLMTLSGRHVLSEAIRLCGGRNVFEALAPIAPHVSIEAVIAADPQMIITAEPAARASDALDLWRRYPTLRAVRAGQLVTLDADKLNRHAPRIAEEIGVLCERIDAARR